MSATWTPEKPQAIQPGPSFGWVWAGILVGILFLLGMQLKLKWFAFISLGFLVLMASVMIQDRKDYFLLLFVLALPLGVDKHFLFHPSAYGISTFGFPIQVSLLPLAALYMIWVVRQVARQEPAPMSTRGLLALAGVLGASAASVLGAQDKLFAGFDLFALGTSLLIFIYSASEIRQLRELRLVVGLLIFSAAIQGVVALAQYVTGSTLGLEFFGAGKKLYGFAGLELVSRVSGLIGHPNNLALFFDLMLPLSVSLLFCPLRGGLRLFLALAIFFQLAGLGVTFSRGGIIGSSLGILALAVFHGARRLGLFRALFLTMAGAAFIAVFLMVVPNPFKKGLTRTEETAYGRWPLVEVGVSMISHHPFFGVGLNNFTHASRKYDFTREQIVTQWNSPVHNLFLFIAGEIGLVGLICFTILLLQAMRELVSAMRSPDPFILSVGGGLFFGLIAFIIHAQVDYSIWTQNRPLWFLLGLAMAMRRFAVSAPALAPAVQGFRSDR